MLTQPIKQPRIKMSTVTFHWKNVDIVYGPHTLKWLLKDSGNALRSRFHGQWLDGDGYG